MGYADGSGAEARPKRLGPARIAQLQREIVSLEKKLGASTRNAPTAIQGLQPIHNPREIFGDGQITARQLLQRSQITVFGTSEPSGSAVDVARLVRRA